MFKNINLISDDELLKVYDETPLWSAPFGLSLLDTIKYRRNIKILDIGSGCGFPLLEIAMRFGNTCEVFGTDIWEPGKDRINKKIEVLKLTNVKIINVNAEELSFKDNYFELIVSNNGINNVENQEKVFSECYRTLSPGGQFVFTFNLPDTMIEFYQIYKDVLIRNNYFNEVKKIDLQINKKRKTIEEISGILTEKGFNIKSSNTYSFEYKFTDSASMFGYFMIKEFFFPLWLEILDEGIREKIFNNISEIIDQSVTPFKLTVPYVCFDCVK